MDSKLELRNQFRKLRKSYLETHPSAAVGLTQQLSVLCSSHAHSIWATYRAVNSEANPTLKDSQIQWAYPRVEGKDLKFFIPTENRWIKNNLGIEEPEPESSQPVNLSEVAGVLVPGLAFDKKGTRLGSGHGYYDRALESYSGLKVGVAYSIQISKQNLPTDSHDIPMDVLVTDQEILSIHRKG